MMKRVKTFAILLVLCLAFCMAPEGSFLAYAAEDRGEMIPEASEIAGYNEADPADPADPEDPETIPKPEEKIQSENDQVILRAGENITIPIGTGSQPAGSYTGYDITDESPYKILTFNSAANSRTYEITQTGGVQFWHILIPDGVDTAITLNGIDCHITKGMELKGNAKLTLLLAGTNMMTSTIVVPSTASLTIDSAVSPGTGSGEGELIITTADSANGAGIGSQGGIYGDHCGKITINGGTVTVTQNGAGHAAIGGGAGKNGDVTINGGRVTATALTGGAAIGSGQGSYITGTVVINDGIVTALTNKGLKSGGGAGIGGGLGASGNVTINGGLITVESAEGAGIGSGGANEGSASTGAVLINNGTINVSTILGACIGGGSGKASGIYGVAEVTINGGNLNLKSYDGAGIGNGGSEHNVPGRGYVGNVYINGGKIFVDFNKGTAVGAGKNNNNLPKLYLDHKADIMAFGRDYSNFPGIDCGEGIPEYEDGYNKGDGFFVNGNFDEECGDSDGLFVVYHKDDLVNPIRIVNIPFKFKLFAFTTGLTDPDEYYVFTGTFSGGLKQIVRWRDDQPEIYSVNRPWDYKENNHTREHYFRSLSVKYGKGDIYPDYLAVIEKHVDINGDPISGVEDGLTLVVKGGAYSKDMPSITGYVVKGYKPGPDAPSGNGTFTPGKIAAFSPVNQSMIMYFVYDTDYGTADVTISKKVEGDLADMTQVFAFTVFFTDADGKKLDEGTAFKYTGGVVPGQKGVTAPADGTLTLKESGEDTFLLGHGQSITIKDIPAGTLIRIEEAAGDIYTVTIADSVDGFIQGKNTGYKPVDKEGRVFEFTNTRIEPVPTGADSGDWMLAAMLLLSVLMAGGIVSGAVTISCLRSRLCLR